MPLNYHQLDKEVEERIIADRRSHKENPCKADERKALRRNMQRDESTLLRPAYIRDIDKILHLPQYNRYNDKTQVFSLYNNDDISRRGLHVQLVSRIARNIGRLLGLDLDLIEAIALGHDIGHTPFGHAGERYLSELLRSNTGRYFNHNVHSVRVLDVLYRRNVTLQVLDGILCHNGEFELHEYRPRPLSGFDEFDRMVEDCYTQGGEAIRRLIPMTLEGCVVRISDMIAYIGKDRQDAVTAKLIDENCPFSTSFIGKQNAEVINNLIVDIVNNSYGKDYLLLSEAAYRDLKTAKTENYKYIYFNPEVERVYGEEIKPMFVELYNKLLDDVRNKNTDSFIYRHHIYFIKEAQKYYDRLDYEKEDPDQIVVDYLASMTDDYFIDLHKKLFPNSKHKIEYRSYFDE